MRASTRKKASATPGDASVSATPPPPAIQQQPQQQPTPAIPQVTPQQIQSQAQSQQSHLAQQAYYQYYQAQAAAAANAKAGAAYNPFAPAPPAGAPAMIPTPQTISTTIPTQPQSYWTTYPSRLRTGVSLLMQPIIAPPSTNVPGLGTSSGRRAARAINYAEAVSADEDDDSDDSEFGSGRARRAAAAMTGIMKGGVQGVGQQKQSNELDQSYLGKVPPTRFIASKVAVRAKHTYYSYEQMEKAATKPESLVPIRVEVDTDTHRIRDCFVWNVNEDLITPQAFATTFCQDLDLPLHHVENIVNMIRAQIEEHGGISGLDIGGGGAAEGDDDQDEDAATQEPDCRVIIRIDVQLETHHLVDHIEWDLASPLTPEQFAKGLCADLGLSGEALPLIAHAVQEEILKHKKDAVEWGIIGGDRAEGGRGHRGPRRLKGIWRDWMEVKDYGPSIEELTPEELERREMERERASRRMRRETSKFQRTTAGAYYRDNRPPRPSRLR